MSIYSLTFDLLGLFSSGAPQLSVSYGDQELGVEYAYSGTTSVNLTIDTGSMGFDSTLLRFSFIDSTGDVGDAVRLSNLKIDGNDLDYSDFSTDRGAYFHDGVLNLSRGGYTEYDASVFVTDTMLNPPSGPVTPLATITGTAGDDVKMYGTDAADVIDALGGNDYVVAKDGDDIVNGGAGNDRLYGQSGNDTLNGDAGADYLYGGAGNDTVNGGADNDRVYGNDGDDIVRGDGGNDRVYGQNGNDDLYGGTGNDQLSGGAGDDELFGEDGDDHLFGGDDDDILHGGNDNDRLRGNDGNDELHGDAGDDDLDGQAGNDTLYGGTGSDSLDGEEGNDILNGDDGNDYLIGGQGADTLNGGVGNDIMYGGGMSTADQYTTRDSSAFGLSGVSFNEETQSFYRFVNSNVNFATAQANAASATLNGVGGHLVTITSQMENDYVSSLINDQSWISAVDVDQDGSWEWVSGSEAGATFSNVSGTSIYNGYESWDGGQPQNNSEYNGVLYTNGTWHDWPDTAGHSYVIEWNADDVLVDNNIDTLNGGDGDDTLYGGGGNDILNGENDNDIVYGGTGNDNVSGGSGNDALYGQVGNDTIDGGLGADFISGGDGNDIITDFFGTNTLRGDAGNDSITAGSGTDYIYGGTGADTIDGNGGNDWIYLANGDFVAGESITGDTGTDTIVLTDATTVDFSIGTINTVEATSGSSGNDNVTVSSSQLISFNTIDLNGGTDTLNVLASGDISGGTVATISDTEVGNLVGTSGGDSITLTGAQLDTILIGSGTINLAGGTDTINLTSTSSDLNSLGTVNASIQGLETISATGAGAGVTITLSGQTENFTITGSNFNDVITGGSGDDIINTGLGSDIVNAGAGNDTVTASDANDTLNGGAGTDTLILSGDFADYGITLLGSVYTFVDNVLGGTDSVTLFENFLFNDGALVVADLINVAPVITSNGGGTTASISYAENGTGSITTVVASDANPSNTITYSISGGADAALFTISAGGVLSFISSPDYETALDSGANNVYDVEVTASDGTLVDVQNIAVTVTDVNEGDVGNSTGTAGTLTVGGSVLYDVDSGGDRDWFAVDLVGGTKYAFWARGTPSEAANSTDPRIYGVYNSGGGQVSGGDDDGGIGYESLLYFTPGSTGTYYIDAGAYGSVVGEILLSAFVGGNTTSGNFFGSTHNGGAFADYIDGNGGNDTINGNGGSDILEGGSGNDTLNGGDGSDVLYGGSGSDTYVFDNFNGVDSVVDFNAGGGDRIDISSLLTGFTIGIDDIDDFVQFQEVSGSTIMRIDANGTVGGSNFVEVAVFEGNTGEVVQTLYDNGDIVVL